MILSDIFSLLNHVRGKAHCLSEQKQTVPTKVLKFADSCLTSIDEWCQDFPVCLDYSFTQSLLVSLSKGISQLEAQAQVLRTDKIEDVKASKNLRSIQNLLSEIPAFVKRFGRTVKGSKRALQHLEILKQEVGGPVENFLELVARSTPERGAGDAIAAASAREDAERHVHQLCHTPQVRAALRLEQETNELQKRLEAMLAPFAELARQLERKKARLRSSGVSLMDTEIEAIQTTLGLLSSKKPYLFARLLTNTWWLEELVGTLHLIKMSAEQGFFTVSKKELGATNLIPALQDFDTELFGAYFWNWYKKLQEQKKLGSCEDFRKIEQELDQAREALSSSSKLYEDAINEHQKSISIYSDITTSFQSLRELVEYVCQREFSKKVELLMPETF